MLQRGLSTADGGFVPARLTLARVARGLKQNELADAISRSRALVSKWENRAYNHTPDHQDLDLLSEILHVQLTWFFKPILNEDSANFFRSLQGELKSARERSAAKLVFLHEISHALEDRVQFPDLDIPELISGSDYKSLSMDQIDKLADRAREFWGMGDDPIDDLMTIIENAGIVVGDDFIVSAKLDGVSRWFRHRPVMLLAKDKDTGVRRRFDAAHELGHILLHRYVTKQDLKDNWRLIEDQAMAFASAFLMPASSFAHAVQDTSLDALANLKPTWKISIAAMLMRLKSLNLIQDSESRNLWKYYNYRGWRGNEPHDDQVPMEFPLNLKSAVEMIAEDGPAEVASFVADTGLSIEDIASLTSINIKSLAPTRNKPKLRLVRRDDVWNAAND